MISREVTFRDHRGAPLQATMCYSSAWCAYAFEIVFRVSPGVTVTWTIDRDMLVAGATSRKWVGSGDVAIAFDFLMEEVLLRLVGPDCTRILKLPLVDADAFIRDMLTECPSGSEHLDLDRVIADILEGA